MDAEIQAGPKTLLTSLSRQHCGCGNSSKLHVSFLSFVYSHIYTKKAWYMALDRPFTLGAKQNPGSAPGWPCVINLG